MTDSPQTPPGWYPDPQHPGQQRYWDGSTWGPGAPVPPPAKKGGKAKFVIIPIVACVGLAVVAVVIGALASSGSDDSGKSSSDVTTPLSDKAAKDVKLVSCEKQSGTGWGEATIKVTNNSSKQSDYIIEVAFQSKDGKTSYGVADDAINGLNPGQSKTDTPATLEAFPGGTCHVKSVLRTAS